MFIIHSLQRFLSDSPKTVFLIDAIGAMFSAFLLGYVLPYLNEYFLMPEKALIFLAVIPVFFAIFSFYNYFYFNSRWSSNLKMIAFLNWLYCLISLCCLIYFFKYLSIWDWFYFISELMIVLFLAYIEYKIATKK